jgi:acyl-CoA synthetase (NDP forming)
LLQVAQQIAEKSYDAAAKTVIALRDGFAAWYQAHPDLIDAIQKLSVITLFG